MSRIIVATNPSCDMATEYLDVWHTKAVNLAKEQADTYIFELNKEKTNKQELTELIIQKNPQLVILNGHGSYNSIVGFDGSFLVKSEENEDILAKRIVHSVACSAGKELGPCCIRIGSLAYIGYKENFRMLHKLNQNTKEEKNNDEIAELFLGAAFEAVFSLIKGLSVKDAFDNSQKMYLKNLQYTIAANNPFLNSAVAPHLYHDFIHQVCLGDGNACF
jgi:hypothetical protein